MAQQEACRVFSGHIAEPLTRTALCSKAVGVGHSGVPFICVSLPFSFCLCPGFLSRAFSHLAAVFPLFYLALFTCSHEDGCSEMSYVQGQKSYTVALQSKFKMCHPYACTWLHNTHMRICVQFSGSRVLEFLLREPQGVTLQDKGKKYRRCPKPCTWDLCPCQGLVT